MLSIWPLHNTLLSFSQGREFLSDQKKTRAMKSEGIKMQGVVEGLKFHKMKTV